MRRRWLAALTMVVAAFMFGTAEACYWNPWGPDVQWCIDQNTDIQNLQNQYTAMGCVVGPQQQGTECALSQEQMAKEVQDMANAGCGGQTVQVYVPR